MQVHIDVFGDVQIHRELLRYAGAVADASPAFERIARKGAGAGVLSLRGIERRQFGSQGQFASGGWAPLAPSTVREKARKGLSRKILRATGELEASLVGAGSGHIEIVQPHQLVFGTSVSYARFHQRGTKRMPRRRVIELRESDRRDMVRTLQRHLQGML